MKSLIIIFGALLLIIAFPFVFDAIDNAITQDYSQFFSGVSTGAGVFDGNVTMGRAIYNDDAISITGVSSNESADTPTASSYESVARVLSISGLAESTTRTLSIDFLVDSTTLPEGASGIIELFRWFYVFVILGMCGGAIYAFFQD